MQKIPDTIDIGELLKLLGGSEVDKYLLRCQLVVANQELEKCKKELSVPEKGVNVLEEGVPKKTENLEEETVDCKEGEGGVEIPKEEKEEESL